METSRRQALELEAAERDGLLCDDIAGRRSLGGDAGRSAPLWRTVRRSHRGRIACQADARVSKPPPDGASSARSKCARQDRGGRQARRQNTPRRTGQRLASFAKRANKTRQRANTAMLVGWLLSRARRSRARGTQTNRKTLSHPTLSLALSFPCFPFFLILFFFFFLPFFSSSVKKRARGAGSGRSQHARKAQPAVGGKA